MLVHALGKIIHRLLVRPLLEQVTYPQQEDRRAGRGKIPAQQRDRDRSRIQHRDLDLFLCQCADPPVNVGDCPDHCPCGRERCRQKQLRDQACGQHIEQFAVVFALQCTARVLRQCDFRRAIVIGRERPQHDILPARIPDDGITGPLVDLCLLHALYLLQVILQMIGLLHGHARLLHVKAHPPL